ncbi:hypothetical protein [Candidatus Williamhamiltonella defendens]|nr:hypothetical protein [Candidatus Hamiltonella defensa]
MGGVSLTEDKMGIDSFKSKFGGILFTEWEGNCPISMKGKLFIELYKIINKLK